MTLPWHKKSLALVLFIIFIAIDWTCSKYINRPKRQNGAHMYLPASYVVPGGEENGEGWGPWGSPSSCSRSCGGGVAYQERECLLLDHYGRSKCQGGNRKYFSCNTQDCPDGSREFRAEQCSRFDNIPFDKNRYTWVPYTRAPNPCELNCMPPGERFYYRHKQKVTDGTRCNDDSFDVCVDGQCLPVGCDRMLGSSAREDKCRKCGGDGSDCKTVEGLLSMDNLKVGYNDVLLIPANATNIDIKEIAPSSNYLACRNLSGHYYLNGNWRIDFPRPVFFAGAWWHYNRKQEGFFAPDQLTSLGPTNEPIYLVLLYQDKNVGIKYEYSIPLSTALSTEAESYNWTFTEFTPCSVSCGGGVKTRNVTCNKVHDLEKVDDSLCDQSEKPADKQTCGHSPCPPKWVEGEWSNCTKPCGDGGTQERSIECKRVAPNGVEMIVPDDICLEDVGSKPSHIQECNVGAYCPKWHIGKWKACNKLCGDGMQTRQVVCYSDEEGKKQVVEDEKCPEIKPENEKPCILRPCEGVDWITTEWSGCDSCGLTQETRTVICASKDGKVFNDTYCLREKPTLIRPCEPKICNYQWFTSEWSNCSAKCGEGVKTRIVFCAEMDGSTIKRTEDASKCEKSLKPKDSEKCVVEKENCPGQLFSGPWDVCSKTCGGGTQTRQVFCMIDNQKTDSKDCPVDELLSKEQSCNTNACTEDDLLQVNATGKPIVADDYGDDDDMCDEDDTGMDTIDNEKSGDLLAAHSAIDFEKSLETEASLITDHLMMFTGTSKMPLFPIEGSGYEGSGSTEKIFETTLSTIEPTETTSDVTDISNQTETSDATEASTDTVTTDETTGESTQTGVTGESSSAPTSLASEDTTVSSSSDSTLSEAATAGTEATKTSDAITLTSQASEVVTESATTSSSGETESSSTETPKSTSVITDISTETEASKATTDATLESGGTTVTTDETTGESTQTGLTGESSSAPTSLASEDTTVSSSSDSTLSEAATAGTEATKTSDAITLTSQASEVVTESATTSSSGETESSSTETPKSTSVITDISTETEASEATTDATLESGGTTVTTDETTGESTQTGLTGESSSAPTSLASEDTTVSSSSDSTLSEAATAETEATKTSDGIALTSPASEVVTESATTDSTGETEGSSTETPTSTSVTTDMSAETEASEATTVEKLESDGTTDTTDESTGESTQTGVTGESSSAPTSLASEDTTVSSGSDSTVSEAATAGTEATKTSDAITLTSPASEAVTESATSSSSGETESSSTETPKSTSLITDISKQTDISAETEASEATTDAKLESGGTTVTTDETTADSTQTGLTGESSSAPTSLASEDTTVSSSSDSTLSEAATAGTEATKTSDAITLTSQASEVVTESATTSSSGETESSSTETPKSTSVITDISTETEASKATTDATLESGGTTVTTDETTGESTQTGLTGESSSAPTSLVSEDTTVSSSSDSTLSEAATAGTEATKTSDGITLTSPASEVVTESATTDSTGETEGSSRETPESTSVITDISKQTDISAETEASEATTDDKLESGGTSDIWAETTASGGESTSPSWITEVTKGPRKCKRPTRKPECLRTKFGCCADNKTAATGPFASGCEVIETCQDTEYGCCVDGVSPAQGPNEEGCPEPECTSSIFGCCPDKITPADGEDNEGCPEIPTTVLTTTEDITTYSTTYSTTEDTESTTFATEESTTVSDYTTETDWSTLSSITSTMTEYVTEEPCVTTEFGCCPDNRTQANGPDFGGCEEETCFNSVHGCCSDNKTTAQGPNEEGCPICLRSEFGCCPDGTTPAHGHFNVGCCLTAPYGCCPDNINSATGPEFEGCNCDNSPYGCCNDQKTPAVGPNLEGCPCEESSFGCCPDKLTQALGPAFEGCPCHTFQFGCCPDGVTVANANKRGCDCLESEFKCCSDGKTPAKGPNMAGCNCATSEFGCCPDGETEAKGHKFDGCNDTVEPIQKACGLPSDGGSCTNYSIKFYYDAEYGACSRFWYGGCEGNGNRFESHQECIENCVNVVGKGVCFLPMAKGQCTEFETKYYFDSNTGSCQPFEYGGCFGNPNRFNTFEECQSTCIAEDTLPSCEQPVERGPCDGDFDRWYFNNDTLKCERFSYGGCKGNKNNYPTEQACNYHCRSPGIHKAQCSLPRDEGNCHDRIARWHYSESDQKCMPFYYSGCGGNGNSYSSLEECDSQCPRPVAKDICELPAEQGECADWDLRWYYDTKERQCQNFYYGQCGGNENNFRTSEACEERCAKKPEVKPEEKPGVQPEVKPDPDRITDRSPTDVFDQKTCFLPNEPGQCDQYSVKWYYNSDLGLCDEFQYGGCGGNENRFETAEDCEMSCVHARETCTLPPVFGRCFDNQTRWYYDSAAGSCFEFPFSGCRGNKNNFMTQDKCLKYCKEETEATQSPALDPRFDPESTSTCDEPVDQGHCADWVLTYFYNKTSSRCEQFYYGGCGGNRNNFASDEQCNRECGEFKNIDVCRQDVDPGRCSDRQTKWFYDQGTAECRQFDYSGCYGNGNRFATQEECQTVCVKETKLQGPTTEDICRLPAHKGDCTRLEQFTRRWYYDETRGTCAVFTYTGCGGNNNNFQSFQNCIDFCSKIEAPVPTQHTTTQHDLCENYRNACENLHCPYGVRRFYSSDKCEVCECVDPCAEYRCPEDHQCIVDRGPLEFIPVCRKMNKPGDCPVLPNVTTNCEHECENDAFCRDEMKCCSNGCSFVCTHPAEKEISTTAIPYVPGVDPRPSAAVLEPKSQEEIDVNTPAGGLAILRCFATGHPLPTVIWKRGSVIIDTKHGRYVLSSTGDLNIIQVVRADSGNYVCVADNGLGNPVTREVRLDVTDPRPTGVYIVAPLNSTQVATINQPVILRCPAGGYPKPQIRWWRGKTLLPLKTNNLELMRDYSLLIHRVQYSDLGQYTCEGYAGSGRPRAIYIMLKAYRPPYITNQDYMTYSNFLVDPQLNEKPSISKPTSSPIPIVPVTQPHYLPDIPARLEPVVTVLRLPGGHTFALGSDIVLECDVKGYPPPTVVWTRNDLELRSSERVSITDNPHRLIIHRGNVGDTGRYRCSASNQYSQASHEETVDLRVDPECKDNPFFANCALIVKGNYCHNLYYAKFCCRSCTLAGQLTGSHPNAIS